MRPAVMVVAGKACSVNNSWAEEVCGVEVTGGTVAPLSLAWSF